MPLIVLNALKVWARGSSNSLNLNLYSDLVSNNFRHKSFNDIKHSWLHHDHVTCLFGLFAVLRHKHHTLVTVFIALVLYFCIVVTQSVEKKPVHITRSEAYTNFQQQLAIIMQVFSHDFSWFIHKCSALG